MAKEEVIINRINSTEKKGHQHLSNMMDECTQNA
jgi:hypothetical protein